MELVTGSQGSPMLPMRMRVRSAGEASCLPQQTVVTDEAGARVAGDDHPIRAYAQDDGSRVTRTLYLILDEGVAARGPVTVETTALGVTAANAIVIE